MIKRVFLLFVVMLGGSRCFAAASTPYSLTQSAVNTTLTATTSRAQAFTTQNLTSGSTIWGWIWLNDNAGRITSPSISDGTNTYTTKLLAVTSGGSFLFFWKVNQSLTTMPTVTASWTGSVTTSPLVIKEFSGIPSTFVYDTSNSAHKLSGTAVINIAQSAAFYNDFAFSAMWNSGANNLTDPPTVNPASTNIAIGSHGKVSNSIYADDWLQAGDTSTTFALGYTVSSSTEVSDVAQIRLGAANPSQFVVRAQATTATSSLAAFNGTALGGTSRLVFLTLNYNNTFSLGEPTSRTVSDTLSNSWVEVAHGYNSGAQAMGISIWACYAYNASTTGTITGSLTGGNPANNILGSLVGTNLTGYQAVDGSSSTAYSSTTTTFAAGSFTPIQNGDIVFGAINTDATLVNNNLKSSTSLLMTNFIALVNGMSTSDGLFVQATAGAINPTFITTAATAHGIAAGVALTTVASAGGHNQLMMVGAGR